MGFSLPPQLFDIGRLVLASASPRRRELVALLDLSLPVLVFSTGVDEHTPSHWSPADTAVRLALRKARAAVPLLERGIAERSVIVGADTIVVLDEEILGKPSDVDEAVRMLAKLQGRQHTVYTGVACIAPKWALGDVVQKEITTHPSAGEDRILTGNPSADFPVPDSLIGAQPLVYRSKHAGFFIQEERVDEMDCYLYETVGYSASQVQFKRLSFAEIERYVMTGEPMDKAGAYGLQGKGAALIEYIEGDHTGIIGLPVSLLAEMLKGYGPNAF